MKRLSDGMSMKKQLLLIKLPDKYEENLFQYEDGLDNTPTWPELAKIGYTWDEHMKLSKLVSIECSKYMLEQDFDEMTEDERQMVNELIQKLIDEYNSMQG